jgi:hypothetical protein
MADEYRKVQESKAEKGSVNYGEGGKRGGYKPTAPENIILPKPVTVPQPPAQDNPKK